MIYRACTHLHRSRDYVEQICRTISSACAVRLQTYSGSFVMQASALLLRKHELNRKADRASPEQPIRLQNWVSDGADFRVILINYTMQILGGLQYEQIWKKASGALPGDQAQLLEGNLSWIPRQIPMLHGPHPVFLMVFVMGKLRRETNDAWDARFDTIDEQNARFACGAGDIHSGSALQRLGLVPLLNIVSTQQHAMFARKYAGSCARPSETETSTQEQGPTYIYHTEAVMECTDKQGNEIQALLSVHTGLLAKGGLYARSIVIKPLPDQPLVSAKRERSVNDTYVDESAAKRMAHTSTHILDIAVAAKRERVENDTDGVDERSVADFTLSRTDVCSESKDEAGVAAPEIAAVLDIDAFACDLLELADFDMLRDFAGPENQAAAQANIQFAK